MRRGAVLRLVFLVFTGWGSGAPFFRASAFYAPPFHASAPVLCPHTPTRTHDFSRVPMGSHLTPIARV